MKNLSCPISRITTFVLGLALLISFPSHAYESETGYDLLVQELSAENSYGQDLLSNVEIHLGAAISNSLNTITPKTNTTIYAAQRGVQASLGIDLFSRHWLAEGAFINYLEKKYDSYDIRMKAFDLKVIYRNRLDGTIGYRMGAGLAARYLTIDEGGTSESYTTPFSVFSAGLETYLVQSFSLGVEVAARNTLTHETPDQSALDLSIRFDGHF